MGNQINLSAAQRIQLQAAVDKWNKAAGNNNGIKIDAEDVFSLTKDKNGNIIVKVDAFAFSKVGENQKSTLNSTQDGQWDLQLVLEDINKNVVSINEENMPQFQELSDSSKAMHDYVYKSAVQKEKSEATIAKMNCSANPNTSKMVQRFPNNLEGAGENVKLAYQQNQTTLEMDDVDITKNITFLKEQLKGLKEGTVSMIDLCTDAEKATINSTTDEKYSKKLKQQIENEIKEAIKELEQFQKDFVAQKENAIKEITKLNKNAIDDGIYHETQKTLKKDNSTENLKKDYNAKDINTEPNLTAGWQKPNEADKLKETTFVTTQAMPANFTNKTIQNMTKASAETAITEYNKKNSKTPINLEDVGAISIDSKTGDILISMKEGNTDKKATDEFYDYRISGFYNPKSQVINPNGNYTITKNNYNTENVEKLIKALVTAYDTKDISGTNKKTNEKTIQNLTEQLRAAGIKNITTQTITEWKTKYNL